MKKRFLLRLCWIWVCLLSLALQQARAADVTFSVNLQYRIAQGLFTVGTDQVRVLGSFSAPGVLLSDADGDKVYSATVTGLTTDAEITYNYQLTHGATVNETVPARRYVVQGTSSANALTDWFNDQLPPYPYAKFFASSVKTIPGEVVRFFDSSEGGAATAWSWTFQGGSSPSTTAQNPTATWSVPGTYTVNMTASNASGSTVARALTVTVVAVTDDALGWWNDAVFYQLYPRSFLDTDGDGKGDLQGMINKLSYLSDLGVTALYVMPVHDASTINFGGYEVKDYKSIAAELGTPAQFDQFVAGAHALGLKVIMDMVFNHTSYQHPWFTQGAAGAGSKYDNYYVFRSASPGGGWFANSVGHSNANFNYYYGYFGQNTPDLNFNNASVRNTIKDVSSYWLGRNADGFRLDAPMFLYETGNATTDPEKQNLPATYEYWRSWRSHIKAANPNVFSVGETWLRGDIPGAAKYVDQGFDVGFQFDIAYGIQDALNNENKSYLQTPVEQSVGYYPFLQFGVMASNHDIDPSFPKRIKDRISSNQDAKAKVAATFLLTTPGVPFVYYGDEVGAGGNVWARAPMRWTNGANAGFTTAGSPWEPIGTDYPTYNVQSGQADANSIWNLYKKLITVRKTEASLRRGGYRTVTTTAPGVYAFMRTYGSQVTFVVLNMASTAQANVALSVSGTSIPAGTYSLINLLNAGQTVSNVTVTGGSITSWVPVASLPANGYYVLKLNNGAAGPNAAPTLDAVANQTLNLEDGAKAVGLTGISDGDYCTQTVTVTATRANTTVLGAPGVTGASCTTGTGTLTLTPLAAGTSGVTVTVTDNGGVANGGIDTFARTFTATVTDIPRAPTGLGLAQQSPTAATVTWTDNSSRETGYRIFWSTTTTKPATANATVGANVATYLASGLSSFTAYTFWVEAYSAGGTSAAITGGITLTMPNLALNKVATASSYETFNGVAYVPGLAVNGVDNSFTDRWSTTPSANAGQIEWIKVDLGASYALSRVTLSWENANADSYYLMASNSNLTPDPANAAWAKANITGKPNQARFDDQAVAITGRYLAIYCYHKLQPYGYSIYELQAFGTAATGNQAPVANAGPDQTRPFGSTTATLTAAGSSDPEGSALTYAWTKVSGAAMTFSSTTAVSPTVSGLTTGTYVFQVSVSDGTLSATDQVQITVAANQAPVANAGPDQTRPFGSTTATLTAAGSSDPEGAALTYAWTKVSGPAMTFSSTTAVSPTISGLTSGSVYVFQVSVSDGSLAATDQVQITVTANQAPVANAGPDQNLAAGTTTATLTAAASSDPEGTALTYAWTKVSGPAATFSSTTAVSPTVSGLTAGTYVFQVSVSDGALAATDQVQVTVAATGGSAYYIINRWQGTYLYDNSANQVAYAATPGGNAYKWVMEAYGSNQRIKNVATGRYINIEGQLSYVEATSVPDYFTSGQWVLEPYAGYTRFRNVWKNTYLHVENLTGFAQCGAVDASFYSGHWTLQSVTFRPLGLAADAPAATLTAYPNPVRDGRLTVAVGGLDAPHLRLLDVAGRTVRELTLRAAQTTAELDLTGLPAGVYVLRAAGSAGVLTHKVMID